MYHLAKYLKNEYESYQHLLILKSCTDLVKFEIREIHKLESDYLTKVSEQDEQELSKEFFLLSRLCHSLVAYAKGIYAEQNGGITEDRQKSHSRSRKNY